MLSVTVDYGYISENDSRFVSFKHILRILKACNKLKEQIFDHEASSVVAVNEIKFSTSMVG